METRKLQQGYSYIYEDEYNKIRSETAKSILREDGENAISFMRRTHANIEKNIKKLSDERGKKAYGLFTSKCMTMCI